MISLAQKEFFLVERLMSELTNLIVVLTETGKQDSKSIEEVSATAFRLSFIAESLATCTCKLAEFTEADRKD